MLAKFDGLLYGQKPANTSLARIGLNIVRLLIGAQMTEPSDELIKELYAQFGFAYYHSECLHRELCNAYMLAPFSKSDGITGPRVDERMVEAFAMTLGQVVEAIRPWTTGELQ